MRFPWHICAVLLLVPVFFSTPAYPIASVDLTLSWQVWQESDSNQEPDSGETISTSGISGTWQVQGQYNDWCCDQPLVTIPLNPAEPSTGYTADPWPGPIAGASVNYGQSEVLGTSNGALEYAGDGSSLGMSSSAEVTGVQADNRMDGIQMSVDTSFVLSSSLLTPNNQTWTATDDPIYLSLLLDYQIIDPYPPGFVLDREIQSANFYVNLTGAGNLSTVGWSVEYDERLFESLNPSEGDLGGMVTLLEAFPLNLAQGDEEWTETYWTLEASAGANAAYFQDCSALPPDPGGDPIPEPSTIFLLGAGFAGMAILRRKHRS